MLRLGLSIIVLTSAVMASFAWTSAYFSDTETSMDNTFVAGTVDLLVESVCHYWQNDQDVGCGEGVEFGNWQFDNLGDPFKFFNFNDIKPGDYGENTIGIQVNTNDSWVCSDITLTSSQENGVTDPELALDTLDDGQFDGELDQELSFLIWGDDGDNVLETDEYSTESVTLAKLNDLVGDDLEYTFALADANFNIWGESGPVPGTENRYVGKAWCFGEFVLNPLSPGDGYNASYNPGFSCDGTQLTNISQSDIVTGDIAFRAVQSRNNASFVCSEGDTACSTLQEQFGASVASVSQGLTNGSDPVSASRSDANTALGVPEQTNQVGTFFSLGFGGSITFELDFPVEDLAGPDITLYEVTNLPYPAETAEVLVSQDGVNFTSLGTASNVGAGIDEIDIAGAFDWIKFVRVVDTTDSSIHDEFADGYDLDGIAGRNYNTCIEPGGLSVTEPPLEE